VFSITILVLQLATQTFGPRMMRNFIRDTGTQISLGAYVATYVYSMLALGATLNGSSSGFTPHLTVTVALAQSIIDIGVLIYFIHHIATSIQLTTVVHEIAKDFRWTLAEMQADARRMEMRLSHCGAEPALAEQTEGAPVYARDSGYLQAKAAAMLSADYTANFALRTAAKDAQLVVADAAEAGVRLYLASAVAERFQRALDQGHGDEDLAATYFASFDG